MTMLEILFLSVFCMFAASELATPALSGSQYTEFAATRDGAHVPAAVVGEDSVGSKTHSYREAATGLILNKRIIKEERAPQSQTHDVTFVITQRNMDELTRILHDISDPESVNYGHHMSSMEIADLTRNPGSSSNVANYLKESGASILSETLYGEYIKARASVQVWEQIFNTEFHTYALQPLESDNAEHSADGAIKRFVRAEKYSVPMVLDAHVTSVLNTVQMIPMNTRRKSSKHESISSDSKASFNGAVYPGILNEAYNIDSNIGHPRATQAVYETNNVSFSPHDLAAFQLQYGLPLLPVNKSIGGHSQDSYCIKNSNVCGEGSLDIQYLMAISQSPTTYLYVNYNYDSDFLMSLANTTNPPLVISYSYGYPEHEVMASEHDAFNVQAIKLSAMGVTIVASSGDDGVPGTITGTSKCAYTPQCIGTSPYVLSIGATRVSL